jgi:hypothetical protein
MAFITFIGVFLIVFNFEIRSPHVSGYKWWFGFLFTNALILAYMYENTIKPQLAETVTFKGIAKEVLIRYVLPYCLATAFARLLIINGYK